MVGWLRGSLSAEARVWTALAPALLLTAYMILGLGVFWLRGERHDAELERRGASAILGRFVRNYFAWITRPLFVLLERAGLPPAALTTLSVLLALAAAVALAAGRFALGGWLFIFAGFCDFFDGRLARAQGTASKQGEALDSILDRYADALVLMGLAWYYRETWVLGAVLATLAGSMLVSYIRAKGASLGHDIKVGLLQRPERIALLGAATALSPVFSALVFPDVARPMHWPAAVVLTVLAVGTNVTALHRLAALLGALGGGPRRAAGLTGRGSVWRGTVAAVVATAVDFALVVALVSGLDMPAWLATGVGALLGAAVNFSLGRHWAFGGADDPAGPQAFRYGVTSGTSAALNAGGVAVLSILPAVPYPVAWALVRLVVFLAWNYPLQRDYVFGARRSVDTRRPHAA
ncbi:MAG: GtrA family protein [Myxococcales bacterium]|nr:GtrA family protein [Myxococcales bacterium]